MQWLSAIVAPIVSAWMDSAHDMLFGETKRKQVTAQKVVIRKVSLAAVGPNSRGVLRDAQVAGAAQNGAIHGHAECVRPPRSSRQSDGAVKCPSLVPRMENPPKRQRLATNRDQDRARAAGKLPFTAPALAPCDDNAAFVPGRDASHGAQRDQKQTQKYGVRAGTRPSDDERNLPTKTTDASLAGALVTESASTRPRR